MKINKSLITSLAIIAILTLSLVIYNTKKPNVDNDQITNGDSNIKEEPVVVKEENFELMNRDLIEAWCEENKLNCLFNYEYNSNVKFNFFVSHSKMGSPIYQGDEITFNLSKGEEALVNEKAYEKIDIIENPSSLDVFVNKNNQLPKDYVPSNLVLPNTLVAKDDRVLRQDAAQAFEKLYQDAKRENFEIGVASAYRSYDLQNTLYSNYSKEYGTAKADTFSARPGHSEHQTGLTLDWYTPSNLDCYLKQCLEDTEEYKWMEKNMHNYGFILSYPKSKESITGYIYEPWHIRYVGKNLASYLHEKNWTLDEYYQEGKPFEGNLE